MTVGALPVAGSQSATPARPLQAVAKTLDEIRPRLRGWLHAGVLPIATAAALAIALVAPAGTRIAVTVYAASTVLVFGVSAAYHRIGWPGAHRDFWQRLDHSAIFVFIAGTFTPVCVVSTSTVWAHALLAAVWVGAAAGIAIIWTRGISPALGVLYGALGWAGAFVAVPFLATGGRAALGLLAAGGLCYSVGAFTNLVRRPNPWPTVFGYHEVFHFMTIVAATCQYLAIVTALGAVAGR